MMRKTSVLWYLGIGSLVISLTACSFGKGSKETELQEFSCSTADSEGRIIQGFEQDEEDIWYLFLPSAQAISDVVVHYTGDVTEVSAGEMDKKTQTITGAFSKSGDKLQLTESDGDVHTVSVMQSDLPSVQIYLNDTDLNTVHQDKDKKYAGNTIVVSGPDGTCDLMEENNVEFKGRGNTTWTLYDKKGYQIKFSKETSVLGMEAAKKWVLLSNASDDSLMRSKLVYEMAENLDMPFVPDFEYVDLWINGEYRGNYMLGEKVNIGKSRLDLQYPGGTLFEHDEAFYAEEDHWLYSTMLQRHFTVKEIVEEDEAIIQKSMKDFETALDSFAAYLYSTPSRQITLETLETMIDVDSFAKYYLVNEYVMNQEAFATSFYWYKDGPKDVIHLGPIWDFDTCMGNDGADYTMSYGINHRLFKYLLAVPEFRARTEELYARYQKDFASMAANTTTIKEKIHDSAIMNYLRWDVLGKPTVKEHAADFYPTFNDAVIAVEEWLAGRAENFSISESIAVSSEISEDFKTMKVFFDDGKEHTNVKFAIWNVDSTENMVLWNTAEKQDGMWCGTIDMTAFNQAGMYRIDAYADGVTVADAAGYSYVEQAAERVYRVNAIVSEDGKNMTVTLKDLNPCRHVFFAVWSDANGQDDLYWYEPERNAEGLWEYVIDMSVYKDRGAYCVHAYENVNDAFDILDAITIHVD